MSSNHCIEFEFPAQIYKTLQQSLNKHKKESEKIGCAQSIHSWPTEFDLDKVNTLKATQCIAFQSKIYNLNGTPVANLIYALKS